MGNDHTKGSHNVADPRFSIHIHLRAHMAVFRDPSLEQEAYQNPTAYSVHDTISRECPRLWLQPSQVRY